MADLRDELAHVLWIGGGPQVGKTTLSRLLAGKYDLRIYNLDWHGVREHALRPGVAAAAFGRLSMGWTLDVAKPRHLIATELHLTSPD